MVEIPSARKFALSFNDAIEQDHFGRPSFRVKKKIFATLWPKEGRAVVKLTPEDQSIFCAYREGTVFFPCTGAWGRQGWTMIDLKKVRQDMFRDAMTLSYELTTAKKKK